MRIAVVGGTRFIGPAVIEELLRAGHGPVAIHRGRSEAADQPDVPHRHVDRRDAAALRAALAGSDGVVDTCAYSRADADTLVAALPAGARAVVLSSGDVYSPYASFHGHPVSDAAPLDEDSPLRAPEHRYLARGKPPPPGVDLDPESYEKIDVETSVRAAGACVLRLPMVYGARDPLRREWPFLSRALDGRAIPIGGGNLLFSRGWVADVAVAIRLALETPGLEGRVYNIAERRTFTIESWARRVVAAAGLAAVFERVPDDKLPPDLAFTGTFRQHMLMDSSRVRRDLGWSDSDPDEAMRASVAWHLRNRPAPAPP